MAYQANIPQATDQLSKSQGDLLGNFQAIKTLIDVNHVDFSSGDEGKHFVVTLPNQSTSPPTGYTFLAGEVGLYNFINPSGTGGTGANEIYLHTSQSGAAVIAEVPLTASNQASVGWCYLPSGLILKWGVASVSSSATVAINGPGLGPNFTNTFQAFLTVKTANNQSTTVRYSPIVLPNLVININTSIATPISYFVIGN